MGRKIKTTDAAEILRQRYVKDDPSRKAALETERVNAEILADLIGTTQSVISRLEDSDYEGHSLSMLNRMAKALNQRVTVVMTAKDPEVGTLQYAFRAVLQDMRKAKGLTISELAKRTKIDHDELIAMERKNGYRPTPLTLEKISRFYRISHKRLATLAGAFGESAPDVVESASRFAAQSESFVKLTKKEREALDEFMKVLKKETEKMRKTY